MPKHTLKAEKRELTGRKVKRLRNEGLLPATIFGKGLVSQSVQVKTTDLTSLYKEVGETGLIELDLNGKAHPVLISNLQVHPVTSAFLHVDFREVDLTQKVKAMVPVELVGESPAEKQGIGTVVLMLDEVEVEALPTNLPEKFEVDATTLVEVEQTFMVSDIKAEKGVEILTTADQVLAKVEPPQKEEVVEAPVTTEGAESAVPAAEVETPKEGEANASEEKKEESK